MRVGISGDRGWHGTDPDVFRNRVDRCDPGYAGVATEVLGAFIGIMTFGTITCTASWLLSVHGDNSWRYVAFMTITLVARELWRFIETGKWFA